jgi:hypothetical protein
VAETRGETVEGMDCVVAREARLTERLPVDNPKLRQFCENWLSMVPDILDALAVYPKISQDARACVEVIQDKGIVKANETLEGLKEFKYVRQNAMRLSYDELHSIEYNHCTTAAKTSLNSIVGVFRMAQKRSSTIELVKVVSNNIAKGLEALHGNLLFMRDLNEQGYDHMAEVMSMNRFLKAKDLDNRPPARFFAEVRKKQNAQILPALGFR